MKSKKQEMKITYNLGKVEIAEHCWDFIYLEFNYRDSGKTYGQKGIKPKITAVLCTWDPCVTVWGTD
jgi:hypothetical protein